MTQACTACPFLPREALPWAVISRKPSQESGIASISYSLLPRLDCWTVFIYKNGSADCSIIFAIPRELQLQHRHTTCSLAILFLAAPTNHLLQSNAIYHTFLHGINEPCFTFCHSRACPNQLRRGCRFSNWFHGSSLAPSEDHVLRPGELSHHKRGHVGVL